jgi:hypothetical protein
MNRADKVWIEKLIEKPRAFRNILVAPEILNCPIRQTMIFLGADVPTSFETPRHHHRFRVNRKRKFNDNVPIF